jgi:hypothetical protein
MKRSIFFLLILTLVVLVSAGTSQGFQGRMGGMGDPYGLVSDESDFLIHPAKIVQGEGVRFYGGYRFTYTGVMNWDYILDQLTPAGFLVDYYHYDGSGQEYKHNALLGAGFPLGLGRMGVFFEYAGKRGDYDGNEDRLLSSNWAAYDLTKDIDNFALRLLYALPIGGFKLGGEAQFVYRQEENENWINQTDMSLGLLNHPWGGRYVMLNLFPFMLPYDSAYWEALFKGSVGAAVGPLDVEFTLRGGFIFGGDNEYEYEHQDPVGNLLGGLNINGDVQGWRIGGDLWARYPLAKGLSIPFLVRVDYQTKSRDGDGAGYGSYAGYPYRYEHQEKNVRGEVGGGIDKKFGEGTRIAAGLYYNYLQGRDNLWIWGDEGVFGTSTYDYRDYPSHIEHQIVLRFAGEHELSPTVVLRMGLGFFYGWVEEDYEFTYMALGTIITDDIPLEGYHWGIGASLGGTVQFNSFTLEPFVNAGYQALNLDGNGDRVTGGVITDLWEMDKMRREWYIGGGLSLLFDFP